jgi:hypothetical protein
LHGEVTESNIRPMFHFTFGSFLTEEEHEITHSTCISTVSSNWKSCSKLLFQLSNRNTRERRLAECYFEDHSQPSNLLGSRFFRWMLLWYKSVQHIRERVLSNSTWLQSESQ